MFLPLLQIIHTALPTQYQVLSCSQRKNKTKNEKSKKTSQKKNQQKTNPNKTQNKHAQNKSLLVYSSAWDLPWSVVDMPSDIPL